MKKNFLLLFALFMVAMSTAAQVSVCGVSPDGNGQFNSPFIKSGTVTWNATTNTLTLNNAVIEYNTDDKYDNIRPIRLIAEQSTIVVLGQCRLTTNGFVAIALDGYNSKNVTIKGNGTLSTSSTWIDIFLVCARLTIEDITLNTINGIANNGEGNGVALTFDNVQATIKGEVGRIGEGITLKDCTITYPEDAYFENTGYGYCIYCGNQQTPDKIIISRNGSGIKGDVNNDGEVNIADVNAVIDMILSSGSSPSADVNSDGEVNIADVNEIIDIILGGGAPSPDHEYVDLGLPSGTLWATCNIGASSPEQYGSYFAWGETKPKETYTWENYKWCKGTWDSLTKYNFQNYYGTVDNKKELEPADDAAQANWGLSWQMPTKAQQDELHEHCSWQWTTMNGVNGYLGTGPSGKTLFLPAAGYKDGTRIVSEGEFGYYWSHSLFYGMSLYAYNQLFFSGSNPGWDKQDRSFGLSIRPVRVAQH